MNIFKLKNKRIQFLTPIRFLKKIFEIAAIFMMKLKSYDDKDEEFPPPFKLPENNKITKTSSQ